MYVGLWCPKRYISCTYAFHHVYHCLLYIYGVEKEKEVHGVHALTLIIRISCNVVDMSVGLVSSWFLCQKVYISYTRQISKSYVVHPPSVIHIKMDFLLCLSLVSTWACYLFVKGHS